VAQITLLNSLDVSFFLDYPLVRQQERKRLFLLGKGKTGEGIAHSGVRKCKNELCNAKVTILFGFVGRTPLVSCLLSIVLFGLEEYQKAYKLLAEYKGKPNIREAPLIAAIK